jgi:hypothetical protein
MHKSLGIFAFTNLVHEESEWQSVSESLSTGAYVGFLFACYSTPYGALQLGAQRDLIVDDGLRHANLIGLTMVSFGPYQTIQRKTAYSGDPTKVYHPDQGAARGLRQRPAACNAAPAATVHRG